MAYGAPLIPEAYTGNVILKGQVAPARPLVSSELAFGQLRRRITTGTAPEAYRNSGETKHDSEQDV